MKKGILKTVAVVGCLMLALFSGAKDEGKRKNIVMEQSVFAEEVVDEINEVTEDVEDVTDEVEEIIVSGQPEEQETVEYENEEEVSICVFGKAKIKIAPNSACIFARIETLDSDVGLSKENNLSSFDKIIAALEEKGIEKEEISLEYFNCQPNYDYSSGKTLTGYYSTTAFSFEVSDIDNVKKYIDVLTENGVTSVDNVCFKVSNMEEQYNNALSLAIENARAKAEKMIECENLSLVKLKEEYVYSTNNILRQYSDGVSPLSHLGKVEIEASVLAVFECK